jgi:hypothetical protein
MNLCKEKSGVGTHSPTIRIVGMLVLFIALIFLPSCGENSQDFEKAERAFNSGNLDSALTLYQTFVEKQPTSKWRSVADKQLDKCREILKLKTEAARLAGQNKFDDAKDLYREITTINRLAIDTTGLFTQLDTNRHKLEEVLLKKKAEDEEVARRIRAESDEAKKKAAKLILEQKDEFLLDLANYLLTLKAVAVSLLASVAQLYQALPEEEYSDEQITKSIYKVMHLTDVTDKVTAKDKAVGDSYDKIRSTPLKYRDCLKEIESSYEAYNEMRRTLDNVRDYPVSYFWARLSSLNDSINKSIRSLYLYLPDNSNIEELKKLIEKVM